MLELRMCITHRRFNKEFRSRHLMTIVSTLRSIELNQPNSFEPQLNVQLDLQYQHTFSNQPQPSSIEILGAKIKLVVNVKQGQINLGLAEQEHYCRLNTSGITTMALTLKLSPYLLHRIEEVRGGTDLLFQYGPHTGSGIVISDQNGFSKIEALSLQIQGNQWEYPRSKWADHINRTEFNKIELIEMPKIDFPEIPLTENIMKFHKDASKAMSDGRYGDVLQECRKMIESLETGIKEWGKKIVSSQEQGNKGELENYFTKLIGDEEKARRLNELRKTLRSYLSLDPHEPEYKTIVFIRDDAKFVLYATVGFINNILKYMESKQA